MIQINLLPKEERESRSQFPIKKIGFGLAVVGVIVLFGFIYLNNLRIINNLKDEVSNLEREKSRYIKFKKEYDKIENQLKIINKRLSVLKDLEKGKTFVAKILQQVLLSVPNNLWLESLDLNNGKLVFKGESLNNNQITTFVENLNDKKNIQNASLDSISESERTFEKQTESDEPIRISRFNLSAQTVKSE